MHKRGLVGLLAGVCLLGASTAGFAHDSWISRGGYRSPLTDEWCCGKHDCFAIPSDKVTVGETGYKIPHMGETVPFDHVLPSEDGKYWRCRRPDGTRRCFFAPRSSS